MQVFSRDSGGQMREVIEAPRRSKISLAAQQECSGPISPDNLRRVREPVTRSKAGVQGKLADSIHRRSRHAESQNELLAFRVLMATGRADAWQEQPFCLEYHHEGQRHRYTPDILVSWGARQEVVEIKADSDAESPDNKMRFALIRELLAEHGFYFRVWKRSEVCAEPRLANTGLILRYRSIAVTTAVHEEIRRIFSSVPQLPLRTFGERTVMLQAVLRLVLDGNLHIDWWEPLSLESMISTTPIGRQLWPVPPSQMEEVTCLCTH
jgi:hypothetical protein